jgi:hypothetical protein
MGPKIKTNILQYTSFYMEIVKVKILLDHRLCNVVVDFLIKGLKLDMECTQAFLAREAFMWPTNGIIEHTAS